MCFTDDGAISMDTGTDQTLRDVAFGTDENSDDHYDYGFERAKPRSIAKYILEFGWADISGTFYTHVATFPIKSLTAVKLETALKLVLAALENAAHSVGLDLRTRYLNSDGSTASDAYFRSCGKRDWCIDHPLRPHSGEFIWVLGDQPHIMKVQVSNTFSYVLCFQ